MSDLNAYINSPRTGAVHQKTVPAGVTRYKFWHVNRMGSYGRPDLAVIPGQVVKFFVDAPEHGIFDVVRGGKIFVWENDYSGDADDAFDIPDSGGAGADPTAPPVDPPPVDPPIDPPPAPPPPPPPPPVGDDPAPDYTIAGLTGPVGPKPLMGSLGHVYIVGGNIQAIVNVNPAGTTYVLSGTFMSQSVSPKAGDKFIGLTGAVMDGGGNVDHAFESGAADVVVKNLTIKNYTAPVQKGTINVLGRWLVEDCDISETTRGAAINIMADGVIVRNCRLHHNAQQGYSVHGDILGRPILGTRFENVEIDHNNLTAQTWAGSEQGGGKALRTDGMKMVHCYSHDNHGSGMWFDYNNIRTTVLNCKFGWNWNRLEFEIGYDFKVVGCDFSEAGGPLNGNNDMGVADILMGNAGGLAPGGGEIAYNKFGPGGVEGEFRRVITGREQGGRSINDDYGPSGQIRRNRNIDVHHNIIDLTRCTTHDGNLMGLTQETDNTAFTHPERMTFDHNTYKLRADQKPFVWNNQQGLSVEQWRAFGHDANSTFEIGGVGAPPVDPPPPVEPEPTMADGVYGSTTKIPVITVLNGVIVGVSEVLR